MVLVVLAKSDGKRGGGWRYRLVAVVVMDGVGEIKVLETVMMGG